MVGLCFTHGEATTIGGETGDLASVRAAELRIAAGVLGVDRVELLDYPDGHLAGTGVDQLAGRVRAMVGVDFGANQARERKSFSICSRSTLRSSPSAWAATHC